MRPIRCCGDRRGLHHSPIGRRLRWLRAVVGPHGKQRSVGPCACHSRDKQRVVEGADTEQRTDSGDVSTALCRKRTAPRQIVVVARWSGIVGGQRAGGTIAVVQLAHVNSTGQDVVVGIIGIGAKTVADTQTRPGFRHDLHQADRALGSGTGIPDPKPPFGNQKEFLGIAITVLSCPARLRAGALEYSRC
jgi:hypothetical protein